MISLRYYILTLTVFLYQWLITVCFANSNKLTFREITFKLGEIVHCYFLAENSDQHMS